jgi:CDP-glycerol glycerophosphotransferase (TagB/SpsB family)
MFYPQALICQVHYAFHSLREKWTVRTRILDLAWQTYYENPNIRDECLDLVLYRQSLVVTGIPFQDRLVRPKEYFSNPWKDKKNRKHIIYAPHHTFEGSIYIKGLNYSTFVEYNEFMLELAERYRNSIYIAFKPHPSLYRKLVQYWGGKWTDDYYHRWASLENAQIEQDEYMGLLKHSDAMIHDCCSFTIEYMYMHKPCLYLERNSHHSENQTELARRSYELHEHAYNKEDIEQFVLRVIEGVDVNKEAREQFYQESLVSPNGQSACQNIISAILGNTMNNGTQSLS